MSMKSYFFFFICISILVCKDINAQIDRSVSCAVGSKIIVFHVIESYSNPCTTNNSLFCTYSLVSIQSSNGRTPSFNAPFIYESGNVFFSPTEVGTFSDTILVSWRESAPSGCQACPGPGQLRYYVTGVAYDSIAGVSYKNPIHETLFDIFPNPTKEIILARIHIDNSSFIHLHIFNELGKDIMTVYDGMLPEGKGDFSFKLPQGMYYVRMETAEGVVTKKVVVE